MTEQELRACLAEAEDNLRQAKRALSDAKKRWTECETEVINCKINKDRITEELRIYADTTYAPEVEQRDQEIEEFRKNYPEICELARQRDLAKLKGC